MSVHPNVGDQNHVKLEHPCHLSKNPIIRQKKPTLNEQLNGYAAINAYETTKRQEGLRESTIRARVKTYNRIAKNANILDPTDTTAFLANEHLQENTKKKRVEDLASFYEFKGIVWKRPRYRGIGKLPHVPLEADIMELIRTIQKMRKGLKSATFLQLQKDTGERPGEAWNQKWTDIDFERAVINIPPEKNSNPRQLKISQKSIGMLQTLKAMHSHGEFIFRNPAIDPLQSLDNFRKTFNDQRRRAAIALANPRISQITFKSLRHFKATMEYHRTRDIVYVMTLLGHKNIKNTLIYTHLIGDKADEWTCKIATTVNEAKELIEQGFEFVTDMESLKLFRKRK